MRWSGVKARLLVPSRVLHHRVRRLWKAWMWTDTVNRLYQGMSSHSGLSKSLSELKTHRVMFGIYVRAPVVSSSAFRAHPWHSRLILNGEGALRLLILMDDESGPNTCYENRIKNRTCCRMYWACVDQLSSIRVHGLQTGFQLQLPNTSALFSCLPPW